MIKIFTFVTGVVVWRDISVNFFYINIFNSLKEHSDYIVTDGSSTEQDSHCMRRPEIKTRSRVLEEYSGEVIVTTGDW